MIKPILYIVIPCYNEEDVLPITGEQFIQELTDLISKEKISDKSKVLFVNDGSTDSSAKIVRQYCEQDARIIYIYQDNHFLIIPQIIHRHK